MFSDAPAQHKTFLLAGGFSVFAGVGERTREGNDLYHEMIEGGVIKLGNQASDSKCTLVYGQMNEPPGARARVGLTGLTVAEYFRDFEGQDVLLFVDNIFRFTQANSEVSALLGRIPSAVGYQPTLATDLGGLQERITTTTTDGTKVLVNDKEAKIFGRVSMDLVSIDITNIPQVSENDLVSFWSEELPINEFSNNNGLISYELMTRISNRVKVKVT